MRIGAQLSATLMRSNVYLKNWRVCTMQVGIRQLRDELRKWVDVARRGDEVVVTERGKPVARLIAASGPSTLDRLIEAGIVTPAEQPRKAAHTHRRVKARGSVSELLPEQRR